MDRKTFVSISLFLSLAVSGCNTGQTISNVYTRPAEINMAGREKIVFNGVNGDGGEILESRLTAALQEKRFEILDRTSLDARRKEADLQQLGLADKTESAKVIAAQVQITGNVLKNNYSEQVQDGIWTVNG